MKNVIKAAVCMWCGQHITSKDITEADWQSAIAAFREHDLRCEKSPFNVPMACGHPQRLAVAGKNETLVCLFCLGAAQAELFDRFWEAMGVKSEDITVDQAIEKYKALEADLQSETAWAKHYSDNATELFAALAASNSLLTQYQQGAPISLDELNYRLEKNGELLEKQP